jgi:arylsulfatase
MATCVEVSGAAYPAESGGRKIKPMEGVSLIPVFRGEPPRDRALFWEHERNGAVRQGKWKLVGKNVLGPEGPREDRWELYDIEADRPELEDLAARNPGKVRELSGLFMEYAKRGNVLPLPKAQPGGAKKK